jgi:hypothetical protein
MDGDVPMTPAQQPKLHPQRCEKCCKYGADNCPQYDKRILFVPHTSNFVGFAYQEDTIANVVDVIGCASHSEARPHTPAIPPLVPPGTIVSVDEDCNITRYDGSINPCCHRPAMTFLDCHVGYLPHGECPKWNYNHREDGQKFITDNKHHDAAIARAATLAAYSEVERCLDDGEFYNNQRWKYREIIESLRIPAAQEPHP